MKKGKGSKDRLDSMTSDSDGTFEAGYLKGLNEASLDKSAGDKKTSRVGMKAVFFALIALLASFIYLHSTSQAKASEDMQRIIEENRVNQELMRKNFEKIIETIRREKDTLKVPQKFQQQAEFMTRDAEIEKLINEIEEFRMDKELHFLEIEKLKKEHQEAMKRGKEIIANQQTSITGKDKKISQLKAENEKFAKELVEVSNEADMMKSVITDYHGRIRELKIQNEMLDKGNPQARTRTMALFLYKGKFGFAFNKRNCVSKVHTGSAAQLADVRVGDQILSINDVDISDLPYAQIMELVEESKEAGSITLVVRHNPDLLEEAETPAATKPTKPVNVGKTRGKTAPKENKMAAEPNPTREVFLQLEGVGGRFGFAFKGHSITKVHPGSAAEVGGVLVGDEIISIDGLPLARLNNAEINEVIKECMEAGNISLVLRHNPQLLKRTESNAAK